MQGVDEIVRWIVVTYRWRHGKFRCKREAVTRLCVCGDAQQAVPAKRVQSLGVCTENRQ